MSQAKTASKNNPTSREQAKKFFHKGQEIKPVKLITPKFSFLGAEFEASGDLVVGADGQPMPWDSAKNG
jgi:hypothetical protein